MNASARDTPEYRLDGALPGLPAAVMVKAHNDRRSKIYRALFADGFGHLVRRVVGPVPDNPMLARSEASPHQGADEATGGIALPPCEEQQTRRPRAVPRR